MVLAQAAQAPQHQCPKSPWIEEPDAPLPVESSARHARKSPHLFTLPQGACAKMAVHGTIMRFTRNCSQTLGRIITVIVPFVGDAWNSKPPT